MHPGRSGTYAEKLSPAASITIAYRIELLPLKTGLLQDTVESPWCQVVRRLARDGRAALLGPVLKLPMTASVCYFDPAVALQQVQHVFHLHSPTLGGRRGRQLCANLGNLPPDDQAQRQRQAGVALRMQKT